MIPSKQYVLIVDYGSQYTQLIARRIRESRIYSVIVAPETVDQMVAQQKPSAIILSGGPNSVVADNQLPKAILGASVPVLAICYGMQLLAQTFGGEVLCTDKHEYGATDIEVDNSGCLLFKGLSRQQLVWMSHGDCVSRLPTQFTVIAQTNNCPIAAFADSKAGYYAIQFHPEVTHTKSGKQIIDNFLFTICGLEPLWTQRSIIEKSIAEIQRQVGDHKVILGLSGGVDSSVCAMLLHRAIGNNLYCIFIDTGLLRLNEVAKVVESFAQYPLNIRVVDAKPQFMTALANISDPEQKRKIIGKVFIDVFEVESKKLKGIQFLAQGTIYPDVIESSGNGGSAKVIKSHHNVGGLPDRLHFKLVEPLRWLFKDEVRKIGADLGLSLQLVQRHPFPGPGLGVRILGAITEQNADILRLADDIFIEALIQNDWYHKVSQAFAVFLPIKSVGVVGDYRRYAYVIALRAVETVDFMTARWAHLPYHLIEEVSNRIVNQIPLVSRVVYDVSSKPPATIEWE